MEFENKYLDLGWKAIYSFSLINLGIFVAHKPIQQQQQQKQTKNPFLASSI